MNNIIEFKNKREENKLSNGFEPERNAFDKIMDMWDGKYKPVSIMFDPDNIELFKRQKKRHRPCSVKFYKCDKELFEKCIKEINEAHL